MAGNWDVSKNVFIPDDAKHSDLYDFYLTNVDNEPWGFGVDESTPIWVMEGAVISSKGESLYKDVNATSAATRWCTSLDLAFNGCKIDALAERDVNLPLPNPLGGWGFVFYAKYSELYADKCNNCTFATEGGSGMVYKPQLDLICKDGKWRFK